MSVSFKRVQRQEQEIARLATFFPDCSIVLETNKRNVIRCPDREVADQFAFQLRGNSYAVSVLPGRYSHLYYICAFLNQQL